MNSDTFQLRVNESRSSMIKCVFPDTTNHYDTLFGGTALNWMDEVAFITATRFTRKKMVTVSLDKTDFKKTIPAGTFANLIGEVISVGKTSLKVQIDIYVEQMYSVKSELAVRGVFTMVSLDNEGKPCEI